MQNTKLKRVILLFGAKQSGKDTSGAVLQDIFPNAKCFAFADELKQIAHKVFGIPLEDLYGDNDAKNKPTHIRWGSLPLPQEQSRELYYQLNAKSDKEEKTIGVLWSHQYMTIRELLIVLGTDIFRKMFDDCWIQATWSTITNSDCETAIITDGRFPNELDSIWNARCGPNVYSCNTFVISLLRNPYEGEHQHDSEMASKFIANFRQKNCINREYLSNYITVYDNRLFLLNNATISLDKKNTMIEEIAKQIRKVGGK
jgi:hypothetical protein